MESVNYSQTKCNFCNDYHKLSTKEDESMLGFIPWNVDILRRRFSSLNGLFSQDELAALRSFKFEPIPNIELILAMHPDMQEYVNMPHKHRVLPQEEKFRPAAYDKSMRDDEFMPGFIPRDSSLNSLFSPTELAVLRSFKSHSDDMYPEIKPRNIYADIPHNRNTPPQQKELHLPVYKDKFNIMDETFKFDVDLVKMVDDLLSDE